MLIRLLTCVLLSLLLLNNSFAANSAVKSDHILMNAIDQKAIQKRITEPPTISLLKARLKDALERDIERPYMWDLFASANDILLQFYPYKDFLIAGITFKTYYLKVNYEDGNYQAIMLVNENAPSDYNSLLIYEALNSEEIYKRYTEIWQSQIRIILKKPASTRNLNYLVKDGMFLDYISTAVVDKNWADYQLKGRTSNHLKNGYWIEKRYDVTSNESLTEDGHYINGLRNGEWNYAEDGPVQIIKTYQNGKCISIKHP